MPSAQPALRAGIIDAVCSDAHAWPQPSAAALLNVSVPESAVRAFERLWKNATNWWHGDIPTDKNVPQVVNTWQQLVAAGLPLVEPPKAGMCVDWYKCIGVTPGPDGVCVCYRL